MATKKGKYQGRYVIVRTVAAGVYCGILGERVGQELALTEARLIWNWIGANTLLEISQSGVAPNSRLSIQIPEILIPGDAIAVIPCSEEAERVLRAATWAR